LERIRTDLDPHEYRGLSRLAAKDLRSMSDELRHLLRLELRRRGLLEANSECGSEEAPQCA
jgi:hypothetical protein